MITFLTTYSSIDYSSFSDTLSEVVADGLGVVSVFASFFTFMPFPLLDFLALGFVLFFIGLVINFLKG